MQASPLETAADDAAPRAELLAVTNRVLAVIGILVVVGAAARSRATGWDPLYFGYAALYLLMVAAFVVSARLPYAFAGSVPVAIMIGGASAGLLVFGIAGSSGIVYLGGCFVAALLFGRRGGVIAAAIAAAAYIAVAVLYFGGVVRYGFAPSRYVVSGPSWISAGAIYFAITGMCVYLLSVLLDRMADRIVAQRRARGELARQAAERREAEADLRRSEELFAGAFHANPEAVVLSALDDGRLMEVNQAFERLTGWKGAQAIGRRPAEMGLLEDPVVWSRIGASLLAQGAARGARARLLPRQGSAREMRLTASLAESDGRPAMLVELRDVTESERVSAELTMRRAQLACRVEERTRELANATRDLRGFVESVTHDVSGAMRGIALELSELRGAHREPPGAAVAEHHRRMDAARRTMERLIRGLAELSRLNRQVLRRETVDVSALAHEVLEELRAQEPGREVEVVLAEGLRAQADRELLRSVLKNLLGNAWKFTAKSARPRIELGGQGEEFRVRDNGAGFDARYAEKLFLPFERLHAPQEYEGTGIGLATVARIVERHGGRVWAEGAPGAGATFHFTLPGASP